MKQILNNYTKEVIKARMLQNATKLWGVNNPNALDPFIILLIDAFSTEIFKVNNDIEHIKGSILEKIARLLTPSIYTYPRPAHAIAIGNPEESKEVLWPYQEFFTKKVFTSNVKNTSDLKLNIPFTSVDTVNLVKAQLSYQIMGDMLWEYDAFYNRIPIEKLAQPMKHNQLFLAVDFSAYEMEHTPDHLSLYCDNPTCENQDFIYQLLPFVSVYIKDKRVNVTAGLSYPDKTSKQGHEATFEGYSIESRIQEHIKAIYAEKFIELSGFKCKTADLRQADSSKGIEFLAKNNETEKRFKNKKLLWIQIDFPPQYSKEIIEGFTFYLNAFPIYNRGWRENESSLDIMGNTIPLVTQVGEEFLYTSKVVDNYDREYNEIPFSENSTVIQGRYTVRKGGMERFSERNALDLINQVIELTRDEVSAFGSIDRDKVIETLRNMVFQMRALDQKVKTVTSTVPSDVNYVIVEPVADTEYVKASYWITQCALANNIRKGVQLTQQNKAFTNVNKYIVLLNTTRGGEREKTGTDAIQAYKYALTTRDKIISKEDIKSYCKMVLQEQCKEIRVSKGLRISNKPKEGFIRTVNIEIHIDNKEEFSNQYWIDYAQSLKNQIAHRAIDGIEYVVQFKREISSEDA